MKLTELRKLAESGSDEAKMEYMLLVITLAKYGIEVE